jgi:uncharacterized membrane protein YesL
MYFTQFLVKYKKQFLVINLVCAFLAIFSLVYTEYGFSDTFTGTLVDVYMRATDDDGKKNEVHGETHEM